MTKLERRLAYYANGKIEEGKTNRKQFKTDGLIGVVSFYDDGTRQQEDITLPRMATTEETKDEKIARLMMEASLQFKYDGGDTPEIRRERRGHKD